MGKPSAPIPPSAPLAAPVGKPWPDEKTTIRRLLSLDTMPETLDHTLYEAPEGWPDVSDRFPIVAMTTQLQLLEDIAAEYAGGRDVVELSGVRNYRWLDISDPLDLEITIVPKGDDVLSIALGPYCRAQVRVGRFPAPAAPPRSPLVDPRPTRHTAREMFDQRLMFHGPAFQGVRALGPVGDDGMLGDFAALPTPGSLLDDLGKLIAYWAIDRAGIGEAALPSGVASVELFGPKPGDGRPVHCDIRIVEVQRDLDPGRRGAHPGGRHAAGPGAGLDVDPVPPGRADGAAAPRRRPPRRRPSPSPAGGTWCGSGGPPAPPAT